MPDRRRLRVGSWGFCQLLLLASVLVAGRAWGQLHPHPRAEPFRLVWSSSANCVQGANFLAELESRTSLLREARAGEHAITFIVETFPAPAGVRGHLTVHKPDGDLTVRDVPAATCEEVQSAMALIAALMIDPLANNAERPRPSSPPTRTPTPTPAVSIRPESSWGIEQQLTARTAMAPGLSWGQAISASWTRETKHSASSASTGAWLKPSLALSAHYSRASVASTQGSALLSLAAAQLSACPVAFGAERARLTACAVGELGQLHAVGFDTPRPAKQSVLWGSVGLALQGHHHLLGPLWLGWEGAFLLPLSRPRFYLDPGQTLHQVRAWDVLLGLGAGLRFF